MNTVKQDIQEHTPANDRHKLSHEDSRLLGLHKMIPNLLTLMALAAGLTAIQMGLHGKWEQAIMMVVIAAILDALDGATARLLNATSDFGAQLDSLSDFLAFGIAPALILYLWVLEEAGKIGWIAMLVYAAAVALRLARYNVTTANHAQPEWKAGFFSGVPSPAGAGLALMPVIIWIQFTDFFEQLAFATPLAGIWTILVAGLMISRIPTWSTKKLKIPAKMAMPVLAFAAVIIAAMIQAPWPTLTVIGLSYLISIPFAFRAFRKQQKAHADDEDLADLAIGAIALDHLSGQDETVDHH